MILLYTHIMSAKPVQISLDTDLLDRIDADPETRARGRSAFVRSAVERYLAVKQRQGIEESIAAAYRDRGESALAEVADLLDAQAWPDD